MTDAERAEQSKHTLGCQLRKGLLKVAVDEGYLGHTQECQKGVTSKTCTCGVMAWLPSAISGLYTCDCDALTTATQAERTRIAEWYIETFCSVQGACQCSPAGSEPCKHHNGNCAECNIAAEIRTGATP